ncbi:hypothetical protein PROFUN_02280 [Planoprotostelium fungivorum]|uniref:NAD(P)-binding protein n=1 Tax=Planoprotostelium fungivorum TaxID=1890364 RepID=A0A2P6NYJ6_9EUKA|nr:hypothetical protein PROFUN_02280 [Planoprotostelium fungivorum]
MLCRKGNRFTTTEHQHPCDTVLPLNNPLPSSFSVCIVGASRGIGQSVALSFAKAGAGNFILGARTMEQLEVTRSHILQIKPDAHVLLQDCDATSYESVTRLANAVPNGKLDALIFNSGFSGPVVLRITDTQPSDFQTAFDVNVQGTFNAAHAFIPLLLSTQEGAKMFSVVNSMASWIVDGPIANAGYCISKLAQNRLVEYLSNQYEKEGLFVTSIHPGAVATDMAKTAPEEFKPYLVDSVDLCGHFMVWLCHHRKDIQWLSGRFLSAKWDPTELLEKREQIVEKDLLKARMDVQ